MTDALTIALIATLISIAPPSVLLIILLLYRAGRKGRNDEYPHSDYQPPARTRIWGGGITNGE